MGKKIQRIQNLTKFINQVDCYMHGKLYKKDIEKANQEIKSLINELNDVELKEFNNLKKKGLL